MGAQWKVRALSTRSTCLNGWCERDRSTGKSLFKKAFVIGACFNYGINYSCHFGGYGSECLSFAISVKRVVRKIAFIFVAKSILAHMDGAQTGHPKDHAEALIPPFRKSLASAALTRLRFAKIQPAVAEKLAVMAEAPQVAGLGEDCQGHDCADARQSL
jgi:hypothetical protein